MNQKTNALKTETTNATVAAVTAEITRHTAPDEAYSEGAFFADTDWQWALKEDEDARPSSMAEHRATAWAFISGTVCPAWSNDEEARSAFYVGYEDRATELADAGAAGYEALAEAGSVADTAGWLLQGTPWAMQASDGERALRAVRAAWAGAAAWQAVASATGEKHAELRAIEALIRAEAAGECVLDARYVTASVACVH